MTREHIEVGVAVKDVRIGVNGDGANETIDQLTNGFSFPAAEAKQGGRILVVHRSGRQNGRTCE